MTASFEKATSEKLRFQEEVNRTNNTIELANRLVKGLEVIDELDTLGFVTQLQNFLSVLMVRVCFRARTCVGPILWLSSTSRRRL